MKKTILSLFLIIISCYNVNGQTKSEINLAKKIYEGTWVNKKTKRYLAFFFDSDVNYVTINDWTGRANRNKALSLDAYKAFIKGRKLILPAENSDHHSSYCELEIISKKLIYRCNPSLNFKDQKLHKSKAVNSIIFERLPE